MRALVTGAGGFVGTHLVAALRRAGAEVVAAAGPHENGDVRLDLDDDASIAAAIDRARPSVVFHLAAQTFVPASLAQPADTYRVNVLGTARVARAVRDAGRPIRLLFASSAEVYGAHDAAEFPLTEHAALRPENPYAASKAAAEAILLAEARAFGLHVVVARAFNHIGPGQSPRFVVAGLAAQLAARARGERGALLVGNLDSARDFLDVRDVVEAYLRLAERGAAGGVYNVCSGKAVRIRDVLGELVRIAHIPVEIREDPARTRAVDVPIFVGDNAALRAQTGWEPRIPLARSLADVYRAAVETGNAAPGS